MAQQNGYISQSGYDLYDTTGTTEDWSYFATGGLGFTFEIGLNEFHPPFEEIIGEYVGAGAYAGKGNREAYFLAMENAADAEQALCAHRVPGLPAPSCGCARRS